MTNFQPPTSSLVNGIFPFNKLCAPNSPTRLVSYKVKVGTLQQKGSQENYEPAQDHLKGEGVTVFNQRGDPEGTII